MSNVRVAVAGVGNCATCLVTGAAGYRASGDGRGLITETIGPYGPGSVEVVAAFDVDDRKVGGPLERACFAGENTIPASALPETGVTVQPGPLADGLGPTLGGRVPHRVIGTTRDVAEELQRTEADVLVNFLPVGSVEATAEYARAALRAGVAFVNAIPVPLAARPEWAARFREAGLPLVGDDVKSQVGATILHRTLVDLLASRGVETDRTYQLNVGGNADFLNMKDEERLEEKRASKTSAVLSRAAALTEGDVYIGPSGYVPWLRDEKVAFIHVEGEGFNGNRLRIEVHYSGGDSPNSAGVVYDAVRWCKLAADRGEGGPLPAVCAYLMKSPPEDWADAEALRTLARARNGSGTMGDEAVRDLIGYSPAGTR